MKVVNFNALQPEPRESKKRCKTCNAPLTELYSKELDIVMGYEPCEHKRLKEMPPAPIQVPEIVRKPEKHRVPEPDSQTATIEQITDYVMSLMEGKLDDQEKSAGVGLYTAATKGLESVEAVAQFTGIPVTFLETLAARLEKQSYTLRRPHNSTALWMMIQIGLGNLERVGNWNQWTWVGEPPDALKRVRGELT